MLDEILAGSAELEGRLLPILSRPILYNSDRYLAVRAMTGVTFEHAQSLKILAATRNCTSAIGLLRLQYEALLRGFWILHVASDATAERLINRFTHAEVGRNEKLPMQSEMMKSLEGRVPEAALVSLRGFQENHWKPLSSFVHGGIHALQRHSKGYPIDLIANVLRASNGLLLMAANLANLVTKEPYPSGSFVEMQYEFSTYLPPLDGSAI